ncbi:hypothetical protein DINM_005913 [Dirofilaria immitis]|nr:hypothetical protein [Dirofilaria immitis]
MEDKVRSESMDNNRFGTTIKIWITCIVILASIFAFILMRFTRVRLIDTPTLTGIYMYNYWRFIQLRLTEMTKDCENVYEHAFHLFFFVVFQLFDIQTEAQPQLMKLLDLSILNEEITKQLNLSMMGVNEKQTEPLDLSVMGTDDEQTEVLDLSIPKVNIKEAADQCNLKKHMLTHTGEKPYICSTCGRSFSLLWNLKIHMQIHNGVKPYSCSQCEKHFTRKSDLKRHMLIHTVHSRKVNVGKVARNSQSHRRSHADEKPCTAENVATEQVVDEKMKITTRNPNENISSKIRSVMKRRCPAEQDSA